MKKLPTAREVRDVLGHVDIGDYRVSRNSLDQQQNFRFLWELRGPLQSDGITRVILDEFATYREAIKSARWHDKERSKPRRKVAEYIVSFRLFVGQEQTGDDNEPFDVENTIRVDLECLQTLQREGEGRIKYLEVTEVGALLAEKEPE